MATTAPAQIVFINRKPGRILPATVPSDSVTKLSDSIGVVHYTELHEQQQSTPLATTCADGCCCFVVPAGRRWVRCWVTAAVALSGSEICCSRMPPSASPVSSNMAMDLWESLALWEEAGKGKNNVTITLTKTFVWRQETVGLKYKHKTIKLISGLLQHITLTSMVILSHVN